MLGLGRRGSIRFEAGCLGSVVPERVRTVYAGLGFGHAWACSYTALGSDLGMRGRVRTTVYWGWT